MARTAVLSALFALTWAWPAAASAGDRSEAYRRCVRQCATTGCASLGPSTEADGTSCTRALACQRTGGGLPIHLALTRWDCNDDCSYQCMWAHERLREQQSGYQPVKYHGKWPFQRVLGMQEFGSVVFSLGNLIGQIHNLVLLHRMCSLQQISSQFDLLWYMYGAAQSNSWIWSAVFHVRDKQTTEMMDYFSAYGAVVMGLYVAVARILKLKRGVPASLLATFLLLVYASHVCYMVFVRFHYGFNMAVCVFVGLATACLWGWWVAWVRHPARWTMYLFLMGVASALPLELYDFPPLWNQIDAHAVWHAATIPLAYVWYRFVAADIRLQSKRVA